jgi:hypothetical protein
VLVPQVLPLSRLHRRSPPRPRLVCLHERRCEGFSPGYRVRHLSGDVVDVWVGRSADGAGTLVR